MPPTQARPRPGRSLRPARSALRRMARRGNSACGGVSLAPSGSSLHAAGDRLTGSPHRPDIRHYSGFGGFVKPWRTGSRDSCVMTRTKTAPVARPRVGGKSADGRFGAFPAAGAPDVAGGTGPGARFLQFQQKSEKPLLPFQTKCRIVSAMVSTQPRRVLTIPRSGGNHP